MVAKRVLLVEEDPDVREMLTFVMRDEGYAVDVVATATEAMERLRAHRYAGHRYALVIIAAIGELEAGLISTRTEAALSAAKRRGHASGEIRRQKARNRAQEIAPLIADIRAGGITHESGIARELTRRKIPTPRGSSKWTCVQVQRLLKSLAASS
jgi:CheY-like chemotaxis protein